MQVGVTMAQMHEQPTLAQQLLLLLLLQPDVRALSVSKESS
jgi:hypothetical protein